MAHYHALLLAAILLLLGAGAGAAASEGNAERKVHVALYYESLCPYSARFVVNHLPRFIKDALLDAADLTLAPYGNARVAEDGAISCQHGPDECLLNTVEACAINAWPDLNEHFPFIYCVENLVMKHKHQEWESCFKELDLDPKPVTECYKSEMGHKLVLKYGRQTDALKPPHKYVPWVVVDGQPLYDDYENFVSYVCKAYKGTSPPLVCQGKGRHAPRVQEVVDEDNGVTYNSGEIKLERFSEDDSAGIKMVLSDDDNMN